MTILIKFWLDFYCMRQFLACTMPCRITNSIYFQDIMPNGSEILTMLNLDWRLAHHSTSLSEVTENIYSRIHHGRQPTTQWQPGISSSSHQLLQQLPTAHSTCSTRHLFHSHSKLGGLNAPKHNPRHHHHPSQFLQAIKWKLNNNTPYCFGFFQAAVRPIME